MSYYEAELQESINWYENEGGSEWIERVMPDLYHYITRHYNLSNCGCYSIEFEIGECRKTVYVGEAWQVANRLRVHAYNLCKRPLPRFGLLPEELSSGLVNVIAVELDRGLRNELDRIARQNQLIDQLRPVLQIGANVDGKNPDICHPWKMRRGIIEREFGL
jgi:hypothetical protein